MSKSLGFKIVVLLGFLQGLFGLLRAYNWVQIGANLFGQGILLLPFVGAVAVMRGLFISIVAFLYLLFVIGAMTARSWVWWPGITAAIINLLLVLSVAQGASLVEALAWCVIPVILLFYFFSQREKATAERA